jgi:hypothetical protein
MRTLWIVALLALGASGQQQQQQPPAAAQSSPSVAAVKPTFTTSSNLVIVDVTVKDKSGKTIDELKPTTLPYSRTASARRSKSSNIRA